MLFERIDREIAPMRERYEYLITHPAELEEILQAGAAKARKLATPFVQQLRSAVGIRNLAQAQKAKVRQSRHRCPSSSNTAKPTASSTSSWWPPMVNCCCKARICSPKPARALRSCSVKARRPCPL